ncbi:M1 family metallopeptidase [Fulvivirgaceae bacterium BMA12]|uniref:Aminopeptidase N n=1 Tax=Agaribacillus aureus TaxID=3051825 RepID=A0ABT8LDQ5_9BACT|nr:M1 family metallopeptidase [Fulvivirgaceae bacterium BMA12]
MNKRLSDIKNRFINRNGLLDLYFKVYIILLLIFSVNQSLAQPKDGFSEIDVLHYKARIWPDIGNKTIKGKVSIQFLVKEARPSGIMLDCGDLTIDSVYNRHEAVSFNVTNRQLHLDMKNNIQSGQTYELVISYHGNPRRGISFSPSIQQVFTVFHTSHWLVCKDHPDDKATLQLNLVVPEGLQVVSTGALTGKTALPDGRIDYQWHQPTAVPTYIFGFAIGSFRRHVDDQGRIKLSFFGRDYSEHELARIFQETWGMLKFFEDRAGVPYPGTTFSLILAEGNISQEMADFAILRNSYGKQVLGNEIDINLAAHELAHQWWGNHITCLNWQHFWLNEGFAVFMSSAYKEFRFGIEEYLKDIDNYFQAYEKVAARDADKSLVFDNWDNPSADDRILVYYKGAYVLHLLRNKLGEDAFWKGIRIYSRSNFGKSVVSADLQQAMEEASGGSLETFFKKWVY